MRIKLTKLLNYTYSKIDNNRVSCIVVMNDGNTFSGVSIKNNVYRDMINAEQAAVSAAVTKGYKKGDFKSIYFMSNTNDFDYISNISLSMITEFFNANSKIIYMNNTQKIIKSKI